MEGPKRTSPTATQAAAQLFKAAVIHLARLIWPAATYLGRTGRDLTDAARVAWLNRVRRKSPERAGAVDAVLAGLRERKSVRWAAWAALPGQRKIEVRLAAAAIVVCVLFGIRAYVTRDVVAPRHSPSQPSPARVRAMHEEALRQQRRVEEKVAGRAQEREPPAAPSHPNSRQEHPAGTDSARAAAEQFDEQRKTATPGEWVVYGGTSPTARRRGIRPVLERGELRQWDDFSVSSPVVMKEAARLRLWYVGCHFIRDEYGCGVGHAESRDGVAWQKSPGPVLTIDDALQSQNLESIAVAHLGEEYLMWYAIGSNPVATDNCASLTLATSKDGVTWKGQGLALSANCQRSAQLWPSVFNDGKNVHLWYADYDIPGGALIHLTSADGRHWQRAGATPFFKNLADPGRIWVIPDRSGGYRALFAQARRAPYFGTLRSSDLSLWQPSDDAPKLPESTSWNGEPQTPAALLDESGLWIWFAIRNRADGAHAIVLLFQKEGAR